MKCPNCGKNLDDVDCACHLCTFCGTMFDAAAYKPADSAKVE